ncbi:MAG: hypothetical protein RLZZ312_1420 [Bacteroidota bacterium]|jgi:exopolyphosphatase/pppGpp-phosphohydrolase
MKNSFNSKSTLIAISLFIFSNVMFAKTIFGGIEVGSKGIKMVVLDVKNIKKRQYQVVETWIENTGLSSGIGVNGRMTTKDIDKATRVVVKNLSVIKAKFNINDKQIFIIVSSGIGQADNIDDLISKLRNDTKREITVTESNLEAKMQFKGAIPQSRYPKSLLIDVGSANCKGGYGETTNENTVFYPVKLNYGTVTLTEKLQRGNGAMTVEKFIDEGLHFNGKLNQAIDIMIAERDNIRDKQNIYFTGGTVWAFFSLYKGASGDNFSEFTLEDVENYDAILRNNFKIFELQAQNNAATKEVLQVYSQKYLISGNSILRDILSKLGDLKNKNIYFVQNAQVAWLVSYIADNSGGTKVVY